MTQTAAGALIVPRPVADAMLDHARADLPNEACGILSGSLADRRAVAFHPARNADESPLRYNVDPDDLVRITFEIDDAGADVVGIFHSHVASAAVPSETDRRQAFYPDAFYVLASLTDRDHPDLRAWHIRHGRVEEAGLRVE
ncbi:MAG: M67 family metallopeptidase [Chloroflexota bacterium]|nr:M67 family metallopeptidase [Chloroflexota bacterium]